MSVDKQRLTIFVDHFKLLKSSIIVILGITERNKLQKLQNRAARVLTFSDYDEDAGYLFELLGWKNPGRQHEIEKATMVYNISLYTGWLQNIYLLGLQYEKRHITLETLRINFASLYHGTRNHRS